MRSRSPVLDINLSEVLNEVGVVFARYEQALVENDVPTLTELFWNDPLTLRYGDTENLYGAAQIASFRAGRPKGPRPRELLRVVTTTYGRDFATVNAEFRNENESRLGRQSQTWVRTLAGWKIVSAHVSFLAEQVMKEE
ncbi:oxalurate catabolism protein HpxZ [Caballeronia sp. LjRoot34]|uniref:oxalurate catabolism protein HpxZ n=1 Tax=Caballeronia sp. LjRoot34 TaxID=3342325 RepID=UPI003ECEE12E